VATLHQVILRRTGVYILPGEPANRWIIETPTITEGLRHRVRRILGPRIEELTELGVAIAQDSRAVLATMLDQHSDGQSNDPKAIGYPQGMANAPRISATQSRDKGYAGERNGTPGGYTPAEGGYPYFTFNGGKDTDGGGDANYDVDQVTMSLPVTNGANGVTLGGTLTATDEPTFSYDKGVSYTGKTETIGYEEQVASASQIFEWKNGGNTVQLSVMVNGKDIADLCWNYDLPKTHRRYCNRWQVPAGWKKGQPLVHLGYTIEDVKSGDKRRWASR